MRTFQRITMNLVAGAAKRYETLEGRTYRVVPTVMLTEGVHAGSEGPLYYSKSEIGRNPGAWNHKPIMLYHPTLNGSGTTACDPSMIEAQKVGLLFRSDFDGRLKTESWLDEEKLRRLDNRVLESLDSGKMVEVSTGLFHDPDMTPGVWNGESYAGSVRNIQPDHLAILPDVEGACSIKDGAGLLRNAATTVPMPKMDLSYDDIRDQAKTLLRAANPIEYSYVCEVYPKYLIYDCDSGKCYKVGYKVKDGKVILDKEATQVNKVTSYVAASVVRNDQQGPIATLPPPSADQLSDVMKKQQAQEALAAKYGNKVDGSWGGWVVDIFANMAVWHHDGKLFRLPYTYDDDKIKFTDGEPEEIDKASYYRAKNNIPIDGTASPIANQGVTMTAAKVQNTIMAGASGLAAGVKSDGEDRSTAGGARSEMVNKIIGTGRFAETDRAFLESCSDEMLGKIAPDVIKGATQAIIPYGYAGVGDRSNVHAQAATQNGAAVQQQPTFDQILSSASPEVQELITNGIAAGQAEKVRLVKTILSNRNNRFDEKYLMTLKTPMLQGLASLAGGQLVPANPLANYSGQADAPNMFISQQTNNAAAVDDEPALATAGVFNSMDRERTAKAG